MTGSGPVTRANNASGSAGDAGTALAHLRAWCAALLLGFVLGLPAMAPGPLPPAPHGKASGGSIGDDAGVIAPDKGSPTVGPRVERKQSATAVPPAPAFIVPATLVLERPSGPAESAGPEGHEPRPALPDSVRARSPPRGA